jgi:D-arabinose 1-dehydrogenase-like Zn-dependent alcohol dehydrogenase
VAIRIDLAELMELNHQGKVKITAQQFPLEAADVLRALDQGQIEGRAVLLPPGVRQAQTGPAPAAATVATSP